MSAFDVVTALEQLLGDSERTSLELPHMTTGQRKNTKKLLEKYPELQCESYGFGAERKLVLFKRSSPKTFEDPKKLDQSDALAEVEVNIKNTFIDDWVAPESEPAMFRSLQNKSNGRGIDFASIVRMSKEGHVEITSADGSNTAKGGAPPSSFGEITPVNGEAATLSPQRRHQARSPQGSPVASLSDTVEELQVRNTFIHFEGASQTDERAVQSMPHGMFKQCILAEVSQGGYESPSTRSGYDTPDTPTSVCEREGLMDSIINASKDATEMHSNLSLGALVMVEGLTKVPAFNGCSAVIQSWDADTKRYNILLAAPGGCQQAKIKQENLRVIMPCP